MLNNQVLSLHKKTKLTEFEIIENVIRNKNTRPKLKPMVTMPMDEVDNLAAHVSFADVNLNLR